MKKILIIVFSIIIILMAIFYYNYKPKTNLVQEEVTTTTRQKVLMPEEVPADQIQLANPASQYCIDNQGKLEMRKDINGGEYGVCLFEDNRQCEEWAMFRNLCPMGGIKITGYDNNGQIECAIKGGEVNMKDSLCVFKTKTCKINQNYLKCE
ncbi:MAG: DUF333 domain-containing protein [Candidatus Pacebacteria bacterium]|nr:DUF333 domain-containing protein [Candidatus Paceibacterota bacterium]